MGKFHSTLVFHPANTGWKNAWQICYFEIFRVVRFVTRFYTWQILWLHAKLVKISHISCFYPANHRWKNEWQVYNTKYSMPMGLSRAFTPDKSSDFAQFVWENITHPQFFILQTVGGKRVTKLVNMKTLMLIDLSRVFTPDKSCAFPQFLRKMSLNSSFLSCGP